MKKYKLLKELPGLEVGTIIEYEDGKISMPCNIIYTYNLLNILKDILGYNHPGWLEEIKKPKSIYELEKGDEYYKIFNLDVIYQEIQEGIPFNIFKDNLLIGNVFLTRQEAEKELEKRKALSKIKKWIWDNKIETMDMGSGYVIRIKGKEIVIHSTYLFTYGDIIFNNRQNAEKCLEECKQEWKILFNLK